MWVFFWRKSVTLQGEEKMSSVCYQNILVSPCPSNFKKFDRKHFPSWNQLSRCSWYQAFIIQLFCSTSLPFRICQRIVFKFINLTVNVLQIYYGVCYLITFHKIISKYFLHNITRFYIKLYHSILTILQRVMCCIFANTINMVKI